MKKLIAAVALSYSLCLAPAFASPQQEKMKTCNHDAKGMKGEERKAFMKTCLSAAAPAEAAAEKSADPKQRMKDCNAAAKGKKGDERKAFMSQCLKS